MYFYFYQPLTTSSYYQEKRPWRLRGKNQKPGRWRVPTFIFIFNPNFYYIFFTTATTLLTLFLLPLLLVDRKVYLKDIKFKDLEGSQKTLLLEKIPNQWTRDSLRARINSRLRCRDGWRGFYECAHDSENCEYSSTITVSEDGLSEPSISVRKAHSCGGGVVTCQELVDAKQEMIEMTKALAADDPSARAPIIAAQVMKQTEDKYAGKAYSCVDRNFLENLVYRTRTAMYPDWKTLLFSEPFRWCKPDDSRSFMRFHNRVIIESELQEFVGMAHPDIIFEVGDTKLHGFIDCTFSIVPVYFGQILVFMLYFSKYDLYVPFYFVLMTVVVISKPQFVLSLIIHITSLCHINRSFTYLLLQHPRLFFFFLS